MSKRKQSYELSFKLKAIAVAEKKSKEAAAREFRVDPKRIREWCHQKDQLAELKGKKGRSTRRRLDGGGRKAMDEEMEEVLFDWIVEMRGHNLQVSRRMIRMKANDLSTDVGFKASSGWLTRFMKSKGLSLRRKTTVCQSPPADAIPKLVSYILHLRKLQVAHKYQVADVIAMDETACWFDMPSDTTVDVTGARSVPLKTTGHEKDHYTVVLSARADGTKLKPYVVFKGKGTRLIKTLQCISGIVVRFSQNGWMNDALTIDYLNSIIGKFSFTKRLMIWDAYRCHTSQAVRAECSKLRLQTAIVPGGYIQAADLVWNACFKSQMRQCYDTWLAEPSVYEYTKGGNMKPPARSLLCDWIKSSWNAVPNEMVRDSFLSCAITTPTSGSKDDRIHCFKPGQPCEAGKAMLVEEMKKLNLSLDGDAISTDPFASDCDEGEDENNEIYIEEDESVGDSDTD